MEQKTLEKIVQLIIEHMEPKEAVKLITELIKAVEKPAEVKYVRDPCPTVPTYPVINDHNDLTWPGWEPNKYNITCSAGQHPDAVISPTGAASAVGTGSCTIACE